MSILNHRLASLESVTLLHSLPDYSLSIKVLHYGELLIVNRFAVVTAIELRKRLFLATLIDIDETCIDNSAYARRSLALQGDESCPRGPCLRVDHVHTAIIARVTHVAERKTSVEGLALSIVESVEEIVDKHLWNGYDRQDYQQFDHALLKQEVVNDAGAVPQEYSVMVILLFLLFLLVKDLSPLKLL